MHRLLVCGLALIWAGCHVDLNDPGTEPPVDQFDYPAGLLMDPSGQWLYVSNGNSDLAYSGGTVQMVDLQRFDCAVAKFRGQTVAGCDDFPDSDWQSVDGHNACIPDPLDPSVVDCDEAPFIFGNQTVKVGNFAGNMVMRKLTDGTSRIFVGVRGDPSITTIDVNPNGDAAHSKLNCFDTPPGDTPHAPSCVANHQIQFYQCAGQPSCMMGDGTYPIGQQLIPTEPFGMFYDEGTLANGDAYHRLMVTHLKEGQVSIINADATTPLGVDYVSSPFFPEDSLHRHGAFDLAPQHPGQGANTMWYITSNIQPSISTFRDADLNVVVPSVSFSVASLFSNGSDLRSIAFSPDGNRMFITENAPPSVLSFDTSAPAGPNMPGSPQAALRDVIDVCTLPSKLEMYPIVWQGPAGTPPRVIQRLYVMCFLANQVLVVDPDRPGVDDTILVGRGPNEIVFAGASTAQPARAPRAYVSNFSEHTIGLIDLEPGSATEHRMTARIGLPVPPQNF